jgi:hypothetical protein
VYKTKITGLREYQSHILHPSNNAFCCLMCKEFQKYHPNLNPQHPATSLKLLRSSQNYTHIQGTKNAASFLSRSRSPHGPLAADR